MKCRLRLASIVVAVAVLSPASADAALRTQPLPRAACVEAGNAPVAVFDVTAAHATRVSVGKRNRVTGGRVIGRQPSSFPRGTRRSVLRVRFTSAWASWRVGARVARISRTGASCETPAFAPTSFWNATIPANVAFAGSAVATGASVTKPVNPTVGRELAAFAKRSDGSSNTWINYRAFTAPITAVPASASLQPVRLCRSYPSSCVPSWAGALDRTLRGVGIDGTYLGGGVPVPDGFTPPTDSDAEAIFSQPGYVAPDGKKGRVYELWGMRRNPDYDPARPVSPTNARWMASWGGRLVGTTGQGLGYWTDCWWTGCGFQADVRADPNAWGRPDSQARDKSWGATATSLSLLGTQVSLRECRAGVIDHAVGIEVPDARPGAWWPAQRSDGGNSSLATTEGMRLTFPAGSTKPAGLTHVASELWNAAKTYGLVIDDKTSSSLNFRVEPGCEKTAWWGGVAAYDQLRSFPWSQLRVIAPGTDAQPNPTS